MSNIPEFSVSELSSLTKNLLEENFSLIRVKGEITNVKEKGHCYFTLKDEDFVLNAVCWSSKVPYLNFKPEEGMEVFAEGKLSTYAKGSISTYSLHVNQINVQGEGALLKLFKERQKKLQKKRVCLIRIIKKLTLPAKKNRSYYIVNWGSYYGYY